MGLLSILTGRGAKPAPPATDRLFAITTAYLTLEAGWQIVPSGKAAVVVQPLRTPEFLELWREAEAVVKATAGEEGARAETKEDSFGYSWLVVTDPQSKPSVEGLAVALNGIASTLESNGYGERLLCAVFGFADSSGKPLYLIYNYKRGKWYPFVPRGEKERDSTFELELKGRLAGELPIEEELGRWFPLWGIPL